MIVSLCVLSVMGAAAVYAQRWVLAQPDRLKLIPPGLVAGAILFGCALSYTRPVVSILEQAAISPVGWGARAVLVLGLALGVAVLSAACLGVAGTGDRASEFGRSDATRAVVRLGAWCVLGIACLLILLLIVRGAVGRSADEAALAGAVSISRFGWWLIWALLILGGMNAGGISVAMARQGWDRAASIFVAGVHTVIMLFLGLVLLRLSMNRWGDASRAMSAFWGADDLLRPVGPWVSVGYWVLTYLSAVLTVGIGGFVGLRTGPPADSPLRPLPKLKLSRFGSAVGGAGFVNSTSPDIAASPTAPCLQVGFPRQRHYLLIAIIGSLLALYGSLAPFIYQPLDIGMAIEQFGRISYLELDVGNRADWVANLALFIPLGFLWMGAVGADHKGDWLGPFRGVVVLVMMVVWSTVIEFVQQWFPIRTVSLNDIFAEWLGAGLGILIWLLAGQAFTRWCRGVIRDYSDAQARRRLLQGYTILLFVYVLLPLDLAFTAAEFTEKVQQGRVILIPFGGPGGAGAQWVRFAMHALMFLPIGVLMDMDGGPADQNRPVRQWLVRVLMIAAGVEFAQLFVFSAVVNVTDWVASGLGGAIGLLLGSYLRANHGVVTLGHSFDPRRRVVVSLGVSLAYSLAVLGLLWWPWVFVYEPALFMERLRAFINPPFTNYYYSGEWSALVKVTFCMLIFVPIGVFARWGWGVGQPSRRGLWVSVMVTLSVGLIIEAGQALVISRTEYVSPDEAMSHRQTYWEQSLDVTDPNLSKGQMLQIGPIPDVTDLGAYLAGAMLGWAVSGPFLPRGDPSSRRVSSQSQ